MKIVFLGTPEFGAVVLEELIKNDLNPVLIITAPDKPKGRKQILTPSPVKVLAEKNKIPVLQPEKIENVELGIRNLKPDLIAVAAYGQIIPKEILDIPKKGSLNVHPSLLPRYRGASPIQTAILKGEKETGVTIILMDEKMDHGPILNQRKIRIDDSDTSQSLEKKLADSGGKLLVLTISNWLRGRIKLITQNETEATFTKVLTREDGRINWKKTARELEREIRAYYPWPGSYAFWRNEKLNELLKIKILKARVYTSPNSITYQTGKTLIAPQNELCVQCGRGIFGGKKEFLIIEKLQSEGKKEMSSEEFIRGHPDFIGTILE
jgi:methionyl-tRNA formyltransferase